ncbi:MAG: hypothetical protein ACE5KM_22685, partial [Planctomycetaceae bacterium]
ALRRVQGKPDPLFVHVFRPAKLKATTRKLPMVDVALRLPGKTQVWIKQGGDGRSGRQARWRFEVRDAKGKLLPARKNFSFIGGGQYMEGFLKFGRQYRTTLNMSRFVRIPKAGEYTVRIHYHNAATIADLDDHTSLKDFIVFSSKSFRLKVTQHPKRLIQLKPGERKRATALIGKLNADAKLKIIFGRYDKSAHKFLSPKSPPGQLLTMGWQAAPVLLETLADNKTSLRKRAWILSLLSTISGEEDFDPTSDQFPFNSHILPAYETHFDPAFSNFSFGISGGGAELESFFGPIKKQLVDRKAQQKFIDRWLKFRREYLDIREAAVPRPAPPEER